MTMPTDLVEAQAQLARMVATAHLCEQVGRRWPSSLLDRVRDLLRAGAKLDAAAPAGLAAAVARGVAQDEARKLGLPGGPRVRRPSLVAGGEA